MQTIFGLGATLAATIGTLVCLISGVMRIVGHFHVLGFESMTLFTGGMALMLFAALLKIESIGLILKDRTL